MAAVGPDDPLPRHDAHMPLLSLPGALGDRPRGHPARRSLHRGRPGTRRAGRRAALEPYARSLKVGLAWAGNPANANDRRRSMPLAALAPLLDVPGIAWFSLHRTRTMRPPQRPAGAGALVRLPLRSDFDGTAALIAELDLVISVDTSIAHLAGALAKPTWILLPFAPDWRWQLERTDSPWYPTARLFRQPRPGDWDAVVRDVVAALADRKRLRPG